MGMNQGGPGMDLRTGSGGEQMSTGRMAGEILNALRAAAQGRMNQGGPGMEMYTDPRSNEQQYGRGAMQVDPYGGMR
tara:strand:+ start:1830 stop:2060 length:231 start_codon:yes stop_codon:yes gene_type:complete